MNDANAEPWRSLLDVFYSGARMSLSDIGVWLYRLFFLPGDGLLYLLISYFPGLAESLEVSPADYGGALAAILATLVWFLLFLLLRAACVLMTRAFKALLSAIRLVRLAILVRVHVARKAFIGSLRRITLQRQINQSDMATEAQLDPLDLAVLESEARLKPGFSLTAIDIATLFRVRPSQAQQSLDKLKKLLLVTDTFGTMDGYEGYRITESGKFFLTASVLKRARTERTRHA